MKAVAVFPHEREVRVTDESDPAMTSPDHVMIRMLDIGICGTDREICNFQYGVPPPGEEHLTIGHEAVGRVIEIGPGVERLEPGDVVVPSVRRPCMHPECLSCRTGHQDFCYTGDFSERGIKEAHGYMAERVVEHERYLNVVPPQLREFAVLTEPLSIAQKAMEQIFWSMQHRPPWLDRDVPPGERGRGLSALVLGVGPVGLLGAMTLVTSGFTTYVYSREQPPSPRTDVVAKIGATYLSSADLTFDQVGAQIGNVDLIYEAVGQSYFALAALTVLGTNGIYVLTGVPGLEDLVQSDPARIMREMVLKNQVLLGTVNAGAEAFGLSLDALSEFDRRWPTVVPTLIAGRFPPGQAPELVLKRPAGIKTVISFEGRD